MKNYKTHNEGVEFQSSWLQGYLVANYKDLKKLFGKPGDSDGYKVDAEWDILFDNGVYATIYNYKDGKNYNGASGIPKTQITNWYIGGVDKESVSMVEQVLERNK